MTDLTLKSIIAPESQACWKCQGTGYISAFGHVHGGICFRCNGTGQDRSKKARAAITYFTALSRCPASALRVGDRIYQDATPVSRGGWATIESIEEEEARGGRILDADSAEAQAARERGDVVEPYPDGKVLTRKPGPQFKIETSRTTYHTSPAEVFRVNDPGTKIARLKSTETYLSMLTKSGTPAKASRIG